MTVFYLPLHPSPIQVLPCSVPWLADPPPLTWLTSFWLGYGRMEREGVKFLLHSLPPWGHVAGSSPALLN